MPSISPTATVREFHVKNGFANGERWPEGKPKGWLEMYKAAADAAAHAKHLIDVATKVGTADGLMAMRAHLCHEEGGAELLSAMSEGDELLTLDALADALYVVAGTAVAFNLPLEAAFLEVHHSNMTKERQVNDVHKGRIRQKGPNFRKADLKPILAAYRAGETKTWRCCCCRKVFKRVLASLAAGTSLGNGGSFPSCSLCSGPLVPVLLEVLPDDIIKQD